MQWVFKFDAARNLLEIIYEGESSIEDSLRAKKEYLASPHWKPGMNILVDFRKTHINATSIEDLRRTAKFNEERQDEYGVGRIAYLVKSKHDFGVVRQMISLMQIYTQNEIQLFMDEAETLDWLAAERTEQEFNHDLNKLLLPKR